MAKALKKISGKTVYNRIYNLKREWAMEDNRHEAEGQKIIQLIEQLQERCDHEWANVAGFSKCYNCGKVKP